MMSTSRQSTAAEATVLWLLVYGASFAAPAIDVGMGDGWGLADTEWGWGLFVFFWGALLFWAMPWGFVWWANSLFWMAFWLAMWQRWTAAAVCSAAATAVAAAFLLFRDEIQHYPLPYWIWTGSMAGLFLHTLLLAVLNPTPARQPRYRETGERRT